MRWMQCCLLLLVLLPLSVLAAPGDILYEENFNGNLNDWNEFSVGGDASIGNETSQQGRSLRLRWDTVTLESRNPINLTVPAAELTLWIRRGADSFSENPDFGEDLSIQFLDVSNNWVTLATYPGSGTPGEIITPTFLLPPAALHSNFRMRFFYSNGSGIDFDYWHVDNLVVVEAATAPGTGPAGEWQFEETQWTGSVGEVIDSSGNGFNGTSFNGAQTAIAFPARPGDPGTCRYGVFDGNDDYVQIPHDPALEGDRELTYTAWIRPDTWGGAQIRQVMAKSVHAGGAGRAQMGIFSENGQLVARAETNRGRFEAYAPLPPTNGTWTHVAAVFNRTELAIYINGSVVDIDTFQNSRLEQNNDPLNIGKRVGTSQYYFDGGIDEVRVYTSALDPGDITLIYNSTHPCSLTLVDHFEISHGNVAVTCEAEPVTFRAVDSSGAIVTGYTGTVTLSTNPALGAWGLSPSANGTLNNIGGANDGQAEYIFDAADNGEVTLLLSNSTAAVVDINISDGSASETSGTAVAADDPALDFRDAALRFYADGVADTIGTQIAGKDSNLAPGAQTITLRAVERNTDTGACQARLPAGTQAVELAYECENPGTCASGETLTINGTGIAANPNASVTNFTSVNLTFDSNATATLVLNSSDAGRLQLHGRKSLPADSDGPALLLEGSSNAFVSQPAGICVRATSANATCSPASDTCSVLAAAGDDFALEISGRRWQTAGESNADFCTGNGITPNFRQANIDLNLQLVAPATGNPGALGITQTDITSGGTVTLTNQRVTEVGVFRIGTDAISNYLGTAIAASDSANIGRFTPAYFSLSGGDIVEACETFTPFSYLGELFGADFTVTARNSLGAVTSNYRDGFIKLSDTQGSLNAAAVELSLVTDLSARTSTGVPAFTWSNGVGTVNLPVVIARAATPEAPLTDVHVGVAPSDADGVMVRTADLDLDLDNDSSDDRVEVGATELRFGRLRSRDTFGPETAPLAMPLQTEYWNGSRFVINGDDDCTTLARSAVQFAGSAITSDPITVAVGSGSTTASFAKVPTATELIAAQGDFGVNFSAPGNTGSFTVDVDLTSYPWLRGDWDQDGDYSNDTALPTATVSFQQYRGHDRIIYWQEILR